MRAGWLYQIVTKGAFFRMDQTASPTTSICPDTPTVVVHVREGCDVYIGRPGHGHDGYFGNPVKFDCCCPVCRKVHQDNESGRQALVACYKVWFWKRIHTDLEFRRRVQELRGKRLGCFCKKPGQDVPCHGDVIKAWLDAGCPLRNSGDSCSTTV